MLDKKIKIIMCDLDGTLLTDKGTASERTIKAIKEVRKKGIIFGLATGREVISCENLYKQWGIDGLVDIFVGLNGSYIKDYMLNIEEKNNYLSADIIKDVINHFKDLPVNFAVCENGYLYMPKDDNIAKMISKLDKIPYKVVNYDEYLCEPKNKLHIVCFEKDMDKIIERSKTYFNDKTKCVKTADILFEYMDCEIDKSKGMERVAQLHNITMDNLLSFGDENNDESMLRASGIGVVMKNGSTLAKNAADYETDSNNDDGIAKFIEKYFLN